MASQHILATPPSKDAILNSLLEIVRVYNAHPPPGRDAIVFGACELNAEMPLLLNPRSSRLACREPPSEFEAVNAHFSAQVHAFFDALHDLEDTADKPSSDNLDLCRPDETLRPVIRIFNQSFDIYPRCYHRHFHTRRLTIQNPERLPLLNRVTSLRILPYRANNSDPAHRRPISLRTPLDLATRLPQLRELDCPWLGERLPIAFKSEALRIIFRIWAGPWRDDRAEFGRAVRAALPLLSPYLTKARLWFWKPNAYGDGMDQAAQMPDLVGSSLSSSADESDGLDPVSLGLRDLGSRLQELDICAFITPELFPAGDGLSWSHMRHLKVEFHPCAPNGRWYFSGPRGENPYTTGFAITGEQHYPPGQEDDDETHQLLSDEEDEYWGDEGIYNTRQPDMFRIRPIAEHIKPLLLAFALSLQRQKMPSLQEAELFTWLTWRPSMERWEEYEGSDEVPPTSDEEDTVMFRWGVRYEAPAVGGDEKGKVTWQVGEDWRPDDEIIQAFGDLVGGGGENMEWKGFEFLERRNQNSSVYV
ncbi:hypothetical protein CHGG_08589 [Chaetomium globosum CBS 148.51]|uniref:Uncharacterized protein n=1 Tax=Chaetomium globosum (strain ATCC 6205 / CBS 148.51 / DSM 1962 / NBRC 6347 / NRRL 1970) TaxID=306901 RepID=Q2GTW5_CHAGB|nr:uncharacterized protein CHGG_08589 [Chaetomium globosum CBS 148.51]EAQ84575.1 hypothetical protein CHGG_08589 [Chaetomium globosum CBS 148.51]